MIKHKIILFVFLLGVTSVTLTSNSTVRKLCNMLFIDSQELYVHQIDESFNLSQDDFSMTFDFNPKYIGKYSIGITNDIYGFHKDYAYAGKLLMEFTYGDEVVYKQEVVGQNVRWFMTGKNKYYKEITLGYFEVPFAKKYMKDMKLKITVLVADKQLAAFAKDVHIVIGVSATP